MLSRSAAHGAEPNMLTPKRLASETGRASIDRARVATISSWPPETAVRDTLTNFSTGPEYVAQDADDHAAVARCLAGDRDAFEVIVERHQRVLFTVAYRMLGDRDAASDAVQN